MHGDGMGMVDGFRMAVRRRQGCAEEEGNEDSHERDYADGPQAGPVTVLSRAFERDTLGEPADDSEDRIDYIGCRLLAETALSQIAEQMSEYLLGIFRFCMTSEEYDPVVSRNPGDRA